MRIFLIISFLFIGSVPVKAQLPDSTTYYKLREADTVSSVYYKRTYYENVLKKEGWCKYEKIDSSLIIPDKFYDKDSMEINYGKWRYYHSNGDLNCIIDFGLTLRDTLRGFYYDWNGKLQEETISVHKFPIVHSKGFGWENVPYFHFFITYKNGVVKSSGALINGEKQGHFLFSKNGKTVYKIITYDNGKVISVQKKLNMPLKLE